MGMNQIKKGEIEMSDSEEEVNHLIPNMLQNASPLPIYKNVEGRIVSPAGVSRMMILNGNAQQGQFQEIIKKENIYFFPKGERAEDLPFLLIHEADFFMFKNLVHEGAFGQEDAFGKGYK